MTEIVVRQRDVMRSITLRARITGRARMRASVWVAVRLLQLASLALGTKASIDVSLEGPA